MKALVHARNFEGILEGKVQPPIVVNMDLTNICNYSCRFCMFGGRERTDPSGQRFRFNAAKLEEGYVLQLPKLWKDWGVKAVCLAGGGEPSLHPDCLPFIKECGDQGLELGFVTNGYKVTPEWAETIARSCKFVGFSVDAGNKADYWATKGVPGDYFDRVIANIRAIAHERDKQGSRLQIGYKFVLDEMNHQSIYQAAELASQIGVNHFQFRPAIDSKKWQPEELENIWDQIERAQKDFNRKDYQVSVHI